MWKSPAKIPVTSCFRSTALFCVSVFAVGILIISNHRFKILPVRFSLRSQLQIFHRQHNPSERRLHLVIFQPSPDPELPGQLSVLHGKYKGFFIQTGRNPVRQPLCLIDMYQHLQMIDSLNDGKNLLYSKNIFLCHSCPHISSYCNHPEGQYSRICCSNTY